MRTRKKTARARPLPELPISLVEPYFVIFTLLSGAAAAAGALMDDVPALVVVSWIIFLLRKSPGEGGPGPLRWLPSIAAAVTGVALSALIASPTGMREGMLAAFSTGLAWMLLPARDGMPGPAIWRMRVGL